MVNTFFQEWAPLFPVLHRPTFLKTYQQYVTDAGSIEDTRDIAQLNLVFCIGAFAREVCRSPLSKIREVLMKNSRTYQPTLPVVRSIGE